MLQRTITRQCKQTFAVFVETTRGIHVGQRDVVLECSCPVRAGELAEDPPGLVEQDELWHKLLLAETGAACAGDADLNLGTAEHIGERALS